MKQERNNEMDLLLRRLGRRDDATVSNAVGDHLDADELSSYAENALPASARTRYTAHLAECSRCRELVVQLSASAGVIAAAEPATVSKPSMWRTLLGSLFTPMVLRYAAPALGLIVVAVIGFVVLRRDEPVPYVTQVTNNEPRPATSQAADTASPASDSPAKTTPGSEGLADRQRGTLHGDSAPAPLPNAAPVVSSVETEVSKDAAAAQSKPEQHTPSANEAPPAPKPSATPEESPGTADTEAKKKEAQQSPTVAVTAGAAPASEKSLRAAQREDRKNDNDFARSANRRAEPTQGAGSVGGLQRDGYGFTGETRSVAGRRFRKQANIWIDTAYDSSRDTTTLRRGSEQYRALIADEPEIKTIADQLDGEFVVVWKGRAYRIR